MMTNSTSQEKVVFLAKAMISANDAVDNLRDKVKIQSTLWTILFFEVAWPSTLQKVKR